MLMSAEIAVVVTALVGSTGPGESPPSREGATGDKEVERVALFDDTGFRRGFFLSFPSSAKGRAVEKVLDWGRAGARPAWRLCQWATRTSLAGAAPVHLPDGAISYEDATKRVVFRGAAGPDLVLELRAGDEYEGRVRAAGEAWPHLLVEQDATRAITLDRLARLELDVDVRLSAFADRMGGRADPGLHAAQLQLFFIVKDVAPGGSGDFLWFGVPFFDSRQEFPPAYRAKDAGKDDATGKLIYTIDGREVLSKPLARRERVVIRKDLLPFVREALAYAAEHRFLASADPGRYAVANMNLGWEMPGAYDAAAEIRGLAVTAILPRNDPAPKAAEEPPRDKPGAAPPSSPPADPPTAVPPATVPHAAGRP